MAILPGYYLKGRNFTAEELIGRTIRIESPAPKKGTPPNGRGIRIFADQETVDNACKLELSIEPNAVVEAKVTLYRLDLATVEDEDVPTEVVTLRDNIEVSFSAIVSEVQLMGARVVIQWQGLDAAISRLTEIEERG